MGKPPAGMTRLLADGRDDLEVTLEVSPRRPSRSAREDARRSDRHLPGTRLSPLSNREPL